MNLFAIVNGMIILVLAEVFREGTRLDEDQSLTELASRIDITIANFSILKTNKRRAWKTESRAIAPPPTLSSMEVSATMRPRLRVSWRLPPATSSS